MAPSEPSHYVTLISNDGFEFIVRRDAACVAGTIRKMLDPQSKSSVFRFSSRQTSAKQKVLSGLFSFLCWKAIFHSGYSINFLGCGFFPGGGGEGRVTSSSTDETFFLFLATLEVPA